MSLPAGIPLVVGQRSLAEGTGVSTYGRMLLAAAGGLGGSDWTVEACPSARPDRLWRWLSAVWPGTVPLAQEGSKFLAPDLYRRAQVRFDVYGDLTTLRPPSPHGIVHWAYPLPLRIAGWINIYTVHDAIPLLQPELTPIKRRRHRQLLSAIGRAADAIVTVSAQAQRDLLSLSLPFRDVTNCGCVVDVTAEVAGSAPVPNEQRYFLVCGSIEPRKNLERIVRAHARSGADVPLWIAGPNGWRADEIRRSLSSFDAVRWLPFQDRRALLALIAGARALLMPSLAEGFGLPVIEAMAMATPVLTSSSGALAETAGDAALLADPEDEMALAAAIATLATDDGLAASLVQRGLRRSQEFSLSGFSSRLSAVYAAAIERRGWIA